MAAAQPEARGQAGPARRQELDDGEHDGADDRRDGGGDEAVGDALLPEVELHRLGVGGVAGGAPRVVSAPFVEAGPLERDERREGARRVVADTISVSLSYPFARLT